MVLFFYQTKIYSVCELESKRESPIRLKDGALLCDRQSHRFKVKRLSLYRQRQRYDSKNEPRA